MTGKPRGRHDREFLSRIGRLGGLARVAKGHVASREHLASIAHLGGRALAAGPHRLTSERAREIGALGGIPGTPERMRELARLRWTRCGRCNRRGPHACYGWAP